MTYNHNFYGISTRVKFLKKIAHSLVREMIRPSSADKHNDEAKVDKSGITIQVQLLTLVGMSNLTILRRFYQI